MVEPTPPADEEWFRQRFGLVVDDSPVMNSTPARARTPRPVPPPASIPQPVEPIEIIPAIDFSSVDEPGAEALIGTAEAAVIPEGGDVMMFGDGGAGKTTLAIDMALHLAAGDDWLGMPVNRPVRVLLIENEGPRALFRAKLRRRLAAWPGVAPDDRLLVWERPWGAFTFADPKKRQQLADRIRGHEVDVLIIGPLTRAGMDELGTLQETRDFMLMVADLRRRSERPITVVLVHHENKGGKVSGAWEGAGDTLLHVQAQGNGHTRLFIQKARWASDYHGRTMHLSWAAGDGFTVDEKPEIDDAMLADQIIDQVREMPGAPWRRIEEAVPGVNATRRRGVRDRLLAAGRIVNVITDKGRQVALDHCPERKSASLYVAEDPTIEHLRPDSDSDQIQIASGRGEGASTASESCVPLKGRRTSDSVDTPRFQIEDGGW
jgi:hypothetical protein